MKPTRKKTRAAYGQRSAWGKAERGTDGASRTGAVHAVHVALSHST